jgi:hypothetical protein
MQRIASALTFLERYHEEGDEFFSHVVRVTDGGTWVSEEQSKQWMHTHSANKPKKFKETVSPRKLKAAVFWHKTGKEC